MLGSRSVEPCASDDSLGSVSTDGRTPLMTAAVWGYTEIVRVLLEAGADPLLHDADGKILLQILHAGRYAYHPLSVSASSIKAPINPFRPRALSSRPRPTT